MREGMIAHYLMRVLSSIKRIWLVITITIIRISSSNYNSNKSSYPLQS